MQIIDKHNNVIYTEPVLTHQGPRHIVCGKLILKNNDRKENQKEKAYYCFPRDPEDTEDLEANGFAPGQTSRYQGGENHYHDSDSDNQGSGDDSYDEDEMEFQRTTTTSLTSNLHLMPESDDASDEQLPGSTGSNMDESDDEDHPLTMG